MPIKFKYASQGDVPAEHASLYVEREGQWVLDAEGVVEKGRLDEFRNTNVGLQKELGELRKQFEGIDPERARALLTKQGELEDANLVKSGDVEKLIEKRLSGVQGQLSAERERAGQLAAKLADIQINQAALAAATKRGLRPTAVPDLLNRARLSFKMVNGAAVAVDGDGESIRYGRDGVTPMSFDEWTEELAAQATHLFEPNVGGGASNSGSGGAGLSGHGQRNPWKKETWNFTEQSRLTRENPALAAQLRKAAGK